MTNLGRALAAYEQKHDISGKKMAADIGISESTLTRLKQGKMPDADSFVRIMAWFMK